MRHLLADGALGELRSFHAAFTIPPLADSDIRYRPELGGWGPDGRRDLPLRAAHCTSWAPRLDIIGACLTRGRAGRSTPPAPHCCARPAASRPQIAFGMEHTYRSAYELRGSEGSLTVDRAFTPPAEDVPVIGLHRGAKAEEIRLEPRSTRWRPPWPPSPPRRVPAPHRTPATLCGSRNSLSRMVRTAARSEHTGLGLLRTSRSQPESTARVTSAWSSSRRVTAFGCGRLLLHADRPAALIGHPGREFLVGRRPHRRRRRRETHGLGLGSP
ncbi:hypothetical protein [Streptomyces sp. KL116D]|uniref:hypothetical protein n=1 Tax=Streptomyces sp. KL116D TaxID=3045152 RepID=UPI003556ADAE